MLGVWVPARLYAPLCPPRCRACPEAAAALRTRVERTSFSETFSGAGTASPSWPASAASAILSSRARLRAAQGTPGAADGRDPRTVGGGGACRLTPWPGTGPLALRVTKCQRRCLPAECHQAQCVRAWAGTPGCLQQGGDSSVAVAQPGACMCGAPPRRTRRAFKNTAPRFRVITFAGR